MHPRDVIDLYLPPKSGPAPMIVLAHPGYWQYDRRPCRLPAGSEPAVVAAPNPGPAVARPT